MKGQDESNTGCDSLAVVALSAVRAVALELDAQGNCLRHAGNIERLLSSPELGSLANVLGAFPEEAARDIRGAIARSSSQARQELRCRLGSPAAPCWFDVALVAAPCDRVVAVFRESQASGQGMNEVSPPRMLESETRFRTMADNAPVLLWMSGRDAGCEFFNARWLEFTGRSMEQELGAGWAEGLHPEDSSSTMRTYLEAFHRREPFAMEYRLRRADGVYRWVYDQGVPRFTDEGEFVGYIGSCVDVTEQRELIARVRSANAELGRAVRERELLIQEVHHRVKNNLQIIFSLLGLQLDQVDTFDARAALESCRSRIAAMALVHERLEESDQGAHIGFPEYAAALIDGAFRGAGAFERAIRLQLEADDVDLSITQAIPLGLILNELVNNSLRHAFPGGRNGCISVSIKQLASGTISLVVSDDGVGVSQPHPSSQKSLGWKLVSLFAQQLRATLRIDHRDGTCVRVDFSQPELPGRSTEGEPLRA